MHRGRVRQRIIITYSCVLLAVVLMFLLTQGAQANVRFENDGQVPFYARLERGEIFHDDEWVVVVFYRPPECIPPTFNLLDFFDIPGVFDCQPPTTEGFEIWKNGPPPIDNAPLQSKLFGRGNVPVWFMSWSEFQVILADDVITITELAGMSSLVTGSATYFNETLHPTGGAHIGMINFVASGTIDIGGAFWVHAEANGGSGNLNIQISMDQ